MLKGARLVVILLFLAAFAMIFLFMPKDFSKAMGAGFDISQVEQIEVDILPVEGGEPMEVTLNQGEEEYVDLITLLQEPNYSRTSSKNDEITLGYQVYISFADSEAWGWSYEFQGGKLVSAGPSADMKTYQLSGGEAAQQKILDFLLPLAEAA